MDNGDVVDADTDAVDTDDEEDDGEYGRRFVDVFDEDEETGP